MAGLKCLCGHGVYIPDDDPNAHFLKMPSAQVTCPKCGNAMESADAWIRYEAWESEQRQGGVLLGERPLAYQLREGYGGSSRPMARPPILSPCRKPATDEPVVVITKNGRVIKRGGAK